MAHKTIGEMARAREAGNPPRPSAVDLVDLRVASRRRSGVRRWRRLGILALSSAQRTRAKTRRPRWRQEAREAEAGEEAEGHRVTELEVNLRTVMDELRAAQSAAQNAERSRDETQMVLSFFRSNILTAGRSGDSALTASFWTEDLGKDVTLRQGRRRDGIGGG